MMGFLTICPSMNIPRVMFFKSVDLPCPLMPATPKRFLSNQLSEKC